MNQISQLRAMRDDARTKLHASAEYKALKLLERMVSEMEALYGVADGDGGSESGEGLRGESEEPAQPDKLGEPPPGATEAGEVADRREPSGPDWARGAGAGLAATAVTGGLAATASACEPVADERRDFGFGSSDAGMADGPVDEEPVADRGEDAGGSDDPAPEETFAPADDVEPAADDRDSDLEPVRSDADDFNDSATPVAADSSDSADAAEDLPDWARFDGPVDAPAGEYDAAADPWAEAETPAAPEGAAAPDGRDETDEVVEADADPAQAETLEPAASDPVWTETPEAVDEPVAVEPEPDADAEPEQVAEAQPQNADDDDLLDFDLEQELAASLDMEQAAVAAPPPLAAMTERDTGSAFVADDEPFAADQRAAPAVSAVDDEFEALLREIGDPAGQATPAPAAEERLSAPSLDEELARALENDLNLSLDDDQPAVSADEPSRGADEEFDVDPDLAELMKELDRENRSRAR